MTAMQTDVQPGTVSLPLKIGAQEKHLQYRIHIVEGILRETQFTNLKLAALNTLGAFKYHQGKFLDASNYFMQVLDDDPKNLNALANMCDLSIKMPIGREWRYFADTLRTATGVSNDESARRDARCLAEQAFALRGIGAATFTETEGFFKSNQLYSRALDIVKDLPFDKEYGGWKLFMITNLRNICRNLDRMERCETIKQHFEAAIDLTCTLYLSVHGIGEFSLLQAHALVHLGYFLSKSFRNADERSWNIKTTFQNKYSSLSWELENPSECFMKALTLAPTSTKVINMTARSMNLYLGGKTAATLQLLDKSVSIDDSHVNWFARFARADHRRRLYLANKASGGTAADRNLLIDAVEDYLWINEVTPSPYYTCELAKVYCELALSYRETEERLAHEYSLKSLERFQQALYTEGGGQLPHIHYYHGLCLKAFGELRYAIEAFKRSVESHCKQSKKTGCLEELLESLCKEYMNNKDDKESYPILSEMTFWVIFAFGKYDTEKLKQALEICAEKQNVAFTDLSINIAVAEKEFAVGEICSRICSKLSNSMTGSYYAKRMMDICSTMKASQQFVLSTRSPFPRNKNGFKYDFFVIYSDEDRAWVLYSLLIKLEQEFGFKGFVEDRDFTPGKSELSNFEYALENSYKVLVILSPKLLEDSWCEHEMQTAVTTMVNRKQKDRILPVKVKECELPEMLKCITSFNAVETLQWEKLVEAIE